MQFMAVSGRHPHKVSYCAAKRTICFRVLKSLVQYQLILVQPIMELQLFLVQLRLAPCLKTWAFCGIVLHPLF